MSGVAQELRTLDVTLEQTQTAIKNREGAGSFANGTAVIGAGLGVALIAVSKFAEMTSRDGSGGIIGAIAKIFSVASSTVSIVGATSSLVLKPDVDVQSLDSQLSQLGHQISGEYLKSRKGNESFMLITLQDKIRATRTALKVYDKDKNAQTYTRASAAVAQTIGTALMVYGLTQRNSEGVLKLGVIISSVSMIGAIVVGLKHSDVKPILTEIEATRKTIADALAVL